MNPYDYHDEEAEKNIVRTLLLNSKLTGLLLADLDPDDFVNQTYRKFYAKIIDLFRIGSPFGLPEVCIALGEAQYITEGWVSAEYTSEGHLETYVDKVKKLSVLRSIKSKIINSSDPKDIIRLAKDLEQKLETRKMKKFGQTLKEYEENISEKKERRAQGKGIGLVTGFKFFDDIVCLEPTHMVVLAARSSIGKSALALNVAVGAAMFEQRVLYFSVEMREVSLMDRVCAVLSDIDARKFKFAEADSTYRALKPSLDKLREHLSLQFLPNCTSDDVCVLARKEHAERPVDLIVVDYLQYLGDKIPKGGTTNDRIGAITKRLKALAGELKCNILLLSQVNRKTEGMPELENLRDSGNIEQDSDLVVMLHREDRDSVVAEVAVKKAREGEAEIAIRMKFNPRTTRFTEIQ